MPHVDGTISLSNPYYRTRQRTNDRIQAFRRLVGWDHVYFTLRAEGDSWLATAKLVERVRYGLAHPNPKTDPDAGHGLSLAFDGQMSAAHVATVLRRTHPAARCACWHEPSQSWIWA